MGRSPRARDVLRIGLAVVVLLAIYTIGSIDQRPGVRPAVEPAKKPGFPNKRATANGRDAAGRGRDGGLDAKSAGGLHTQIPDRAGDATET